MFTYLLDRIEKNNKPIVSRPKLETIKKKMLSSKNQFIGQVGYKVFKIKASHRNR